MTKRANHLHRYRRVYLGTNGYKVYKCIQPGCTHYTPVHLVEGALCECNRCGEAMIMDKAAMQLAKPHCRSCTKSKKKQEISRIEEFLEQI